MKAPDKIYLNAPKEGTLDHLIGESELDMATWDTRQSNDCINIEYIRKEAIIEWAKEKQYNSMTIVADNFWQEVIDKINSL